MSTVTQTSDSSVARGKTSKVIGDIVRYTVLIVLAFSFIIPFYWMASSAIKNDSQVFSVPPVWIPKPAYWENFVNSWMQYNFNTYMFNTLVRYAIPVSLLSVLSNAVIAYGFSRLNWPGRDILFFLCLSTLMIPFQVRMVPLFIIFRNLGWLNSYKPLVIPSLFGNPFYIFMLRQFFRTIPSELSDAARIDGANELQIMWRVILPLTVPALAVVALFRLMGAWNDYLGPLIYVQKENMYPLALGINALRIALGDASNTPLLYPYLMAVSTVATVPVLLIFFFAQRTFVEGISMTGLKG
jgi:multiple sugar transport system permease protein